MKKVDNKLPREARTCKTCSIGAIENEEHFILECTFYDNIRAKTQFFPSVDTLFNNDTIERLGDYVILALEKRREKELIEELTTSAVLMTCEFT